MCPNRLQTVNPTTEDILHDYPLMSDKTVEQLITQAHRRYLSWRRVSMAERGKIFSKLSHLLRSRQQDYAKIITQEMGKPISQATAEIEKCALVCDYYITHASEFLAPRTIATNMATSYVCYQPMGIIFAIMPWNFPFWQVFRYAAPTLMAGNVTVLSHAPISTGAAIAIEQLFKEADCPDHVFTNLIIDTQQAAKVIAHPHIMGATLTGSPRAGRAVSMASGQQLKKVVLELGGSDPYIILEDADLDKAATQLVSARLNNCGQVCIAPKRIIAVSAIQQRLEDKILAQARRIQMGDPMQQNTQLGPMARSDLRDSLDKQVQDTIQKGGQCLLGGQRAAGKGFYYPVTVLSQVTAPMPAYHEELFGPVITLINAKDETHAIEIANDSPYGLGAGVFTENPVRGKEIAEDKLHAGTCVVNTTVASDPRMPFGGIKQSGHGRELSKEGIRSFMNCKAVNIAS